MKTINKFLLILAFLLANSYTFAQSKEENPVKKVESTTETKSDPLTFNAVVQGGFFRNFNGGIKTGSAYMGRVHLTLSFDTEKAGLWKIRAVLHQCCKCAWGYSYSHLYRRFSTYF